MEYNLADLFESVVDVVPDREALVYADHPSTGAERRLTYAELDSAANRVGHHLLDAGVRPGEHVGLHLYNGVEYLQTALGCLKARIVPVYVNYRYVEDELVYLYRDADLAGLIFDAEFTGLVAAALPHTDALRHLVRVGAPAPGAADVSAVAFADAEAGASPERVFAPRSGDDQFNFGQRVVLHRKFVPEQVLRTIEKEKVTSMSLVGDAMLRPLIDALEGPLKGVDMTSMFSVSSSGAIMSDTVRRKFRALVPNVMLLNNFDSSESGFNGTATEDSGPERGFRVRVNSRTQVVDPATHEPVAVGEVGRVAQCGHVPLGYYNDVRRTAETFFEKDGERWVLLGDMATVDEEGVVTVLGRGSQCINTGGEKVYPEEVEQALKSHPDVYDALAAGVPDAKWGHRVAAVVQLRGGATRPSPEEIQTHCRSRLAGYKIPRRLVIAETLRRSPSGKADYRWAREVAQAGG